MFGYDSAVSPNSRNLRVLFVPALVCAAISVALIRSGFLSILFLAPLGYTAAVYSPAAAWLAFVCAAILNGGFSLGLGLYYRTGLGGIWLEVLHYTAIALGFTWIMAGGNNGTVFRIRTLYRFIAASVLGALTFLGIAYTARRNAGFSAAIKSLTEMLSSMYLSGADAARRSFLERVLTPEKVMEALVSVALRGGALVSAFFLFFVNRQAARTLAWIFRRRRAATGLGAFHAPVNTIWVLSISLAVILCSKILKAEILEIAAWNILAVCAMVFLAQGGGIAQYSLTRRPMPPVMRLLCNVLIVVVVCSPGVNIAALGLLILLGIAENWLPLRVPRQDSA